MWDALTTELILKGLFSAGLLMAVAKVLVAVIERHKHREVSFVMKPNGELEVSMKGHTLEDEKIIMEQISQGKRKPKRLSG